MQDLLERISHFSTDITSDVLKMAAQADLIRYSLEDTDIIYHDGCAAFDRGDMDTATANFALLLLLLPADSRIWFALAIAIKEQGKMELASFLLWYSLTLDMNNPFAFFHIGECMCHLGDINTARQVLGVVVTLCFDLVNEDLRYATLCQQAKERLNEINN